MILLNFSHPITDLQRAQITALTGAEPARVIDALPQFDDQQPFAEQVQALLAELPLTPAQWQGEPLLVVLPSLNFIAAALLAELHGRMGYFPPVVRTRPVAGSVLRQFEVAEILNLQAIRERARGERKA
ncbi:MAG: CRISPR-associated protein Csx15 [Caldilineaceae bacterium]